MILSEYEKQAICKKWIERGRPWFDIDKSKEPTYAERQIILEMKKRENTKSKRDMELEERAADIRRKYSGKISDKIFELN